MNLGRPDTRRKRSVNLDPHFISVLLEVAVLGAETVKGVIRLGLSTNESREDVGLGGTGNTARLIDISNVDLDGSVVLGSDETAGGRAIYVKRKEEDKLGHGR